MKKLLSLAVLLGGLSWMVGCTPEPAPATVAPPTKGDTDKYKNSAKPVKPDADMPDVDKAPDAVKPDADKPEDKKPDADKPDADKPEDKKPDADKPEDKPADKTDEPK